MCETVNDASNGSAAIRHDLFRTHLSTLWLGLAFSVPSAIGVAEENWRSRFEQEYPAAAAKVVLFYHNLSITEHEYGERVNEKRKYNAAIDSVAINVSPANPQDGPSRIYVYRPDVFLRGHRNVGDEGAIVLDELQRPPMCDDLETIRVRVKLPYAAFSCLELTVAEFMEQPTFVIEQIREKTEGSEPLVEVYWKCEFTAVKGGVLKRQGTFLFDPFRLWVLRGYTIGVEGNAARMACAISYNGEARGVPLIREAKYWTDREGERSQDVVNRIIDIDLDTPPDEVFRLSHYGISDDLLSTKLESSSPWAFYFMLGNACAVAALAIYLIARRVRTESGSR